MVRVRTLSGVAAYVVSEIQELDQSLIARYRALGAESLAKYGGRYLVRGGSPEAAEGRWPDERRLTIVEFPTMEQLRAWYASPEYARALELRGRAFERVLLFVDGVPEGGAETGP
jgi:uncharacterized protein (DUF1330 family)